jgi:hypothetical protein
MLTAARIEVIAASPQICFVTRSRGFQSYAPAFPHVEIVKEQKF